MILHVTVEMSVVEFRRLNSFEWAVLQVLSTFKEDVPSIVETSNELCIREPAFLITALDTLGRAGAIKPKNDAFEPFEFKDFEITEMGLKAFHDEGWEEPHEEGRSDTISFEWPSLRACPFRRNEQHREKRRPSPSEDEVQGRLSAQDLEVWLNSNGGGHCWRVKSYFVTNVEAQ